MAVEGFSVPVVDLAKLESEKEKLAAAAEGGCFRVINHGISETLMKDMRASLRDFFELPLEVKRRNANSIIGGGYVAPNQISALYEALGVYDASSPTDVLTFCSQLDLSSRQREILSAYASKIHGLSVSLAFKIAEVLGITSCSFQEWSSILRMNRFNFTKETLFGTCAVRVHTDHSFISVILDDDSNNGLDIMDSNGNFVAVDHVPGTILVVMGDMGQVWSNGRLCNVKHRISCKKAEPRFSAALFMLAPKDNKIMPQAELIDSKHPQLYQSVDYMEYRKRYITTRAEAGEVILHWAVDKADQMTA